MSDQLLVNVLQNVMLAGGATTTIPHGLKVRGQGVAPTQVICDRNSPIGVVGIDTLGVSFANLSGALASANFRVEYDHSIHAQGATPVTWKGDAASTAVLAIYGAFSDVLDQPLTAGVPATVQFNTIEVQSGVTVANNALGQPTRLTVPATGVYAFTISPQLVHTGGGTTTISFWAKVNEVVVPRSASSLEMGNNNNRTLPFLELLLPMNAGQYLEWAFLSTGTNTSLEHFAANGVVPEIPSVIASVKCLSLAP